MQQFKTPFSPSYWKCAFSELRSIRMLVLAALIVAVRVALKSIAIPVGDSLNITVGFFANALGSMLYGPIVALLGGMASDILGYVLFPKGAFFFPFTLVEMLGSFLFALWLYRARLSPVRIFASKLTVNVVCNILLTPIFLSWMYGKEVMVYLIPRIAKNLCIFPVEGVLLTLFLGAIVPILPRLGLDVGEQPDLKITKKHILVLVLLFALAAAGVALYYGVFKK